MRGQFLIAQIAVASEAEAPVIGWITDQHAAFCSVHLEDRKPLVDQCTSDALPLLIRPHRYRTKPVSTVAFNSNRNWRESYVPHDVSTSDGNKRNRQITIIPQPGNDRSLRTIAERRGFESRDGQVVNGLLIVRLLWSDEHSHEEMPQGYYFPARRPAS
ncbi:hypothetical protein X757_14955 [Mesorhizobium sp. LSHC414A00]|nr:hypothetical protein X757_14955 [Mesorhizobium sp. LSHC414A00]